MQSTPEQLKEFEELMGELAAGSEEAAWKITDQYTPHIIKVIRRSLPKAIRSKVDSQDFTQAVWASLLLRRTYLAKMQSPGQLIGFLAAVAKNKVIDSCRHYLGTQAYNVRRETSMTAVENEEKSARLSQQGSSAAKQAFTSRDPTPSQIVSVRERWHSVLDSCSARDKKIVSLRMKGLTYKDISEKLELGNATVRRVLGSLIGQLSE